MVSKVRRLDYIDDGTGVGGLRLQPETFTNWRRGDERQVHLMEVPREEKHSRPPPTTITLGAMIEVDGDEPEMVGLEVDEKGEGMRSVRCFC